MNTFIGTKVKQTQGFLENGNRTPITVVNAPDLFVVGTKTVEKEGYNAVRVGFGTSKKPTKAIMGIAKLANMAVAPRKIVEERLSDAPTQELGATIKVDEVLSIGDIVDVTGVSKGKGFAGGVKRYGFRGGPKTHGQSDRHRAPGSIGSGTTPGRVYKGKRMAGNMGKEQVTVKNLTVIDLNADEKIIMIGGLVPGIMGGTISITKVGEVKEKNFSPLFKIVADAPVEETMSEPVIEDAAVSGEAEVPEVSEGVPEVEVVAEAAPEEVKEEDESTSNVAEANVESEESKGEAK
ncbi:MAG: 50S ribosomal protein L3 [Candidatus Levybacteria bacterium]|nr:50S ribosomal protein L3 [Candidatus Levybacteria bacterium]